jgi:hypothetical protein
MATDTTRTAPADEPLSDADRAAIERALAEPGIAISTNELAALLADDGDGEVRELLAAGKAAEAIGLARFYAFERDYNWGEPRNRPLPLDDEPL